MQGECHLQEVCHQHHLLEGGHHLQELILSKHLMTSHPTCEPLRIGPPLHSEERLVMGQVLGKAQLVKFGLMCREGELPPLVSFEVTAPQAKIMWTSPVERLLTVRAASTLPRSRVCPAVGLLPRGQRIPKGGCPQEMMTMDVPA